MFVASSNVSPDFFGAATKRKNSRDLLQRYFRPRQGMSLSPLVDQFAIEVNTAARADGLIVRMYGKDTGPSGSQIDNVALAVGYSVN